MFSLTWTWPARRAGGLPLARALWALVLAAVLMTSGPTALAGHDTCGGCDSATTYVSPQFAYEVQWQEPWELFPLMTYSEEGAYDSAAIFGPGTSIRLFFLFGNDLEAALEAALEASADGRDDVEVVGWDHGVDALGLPYAAATLAYDTTDEDGRTVHLFEYIEVGRVVANDRSDGIRVVNLYADAEEISAVYDEVQTTFVVNEGTTGPFFAGRPAGGDDDRGPRRGRGDAGGSDAEAEYLEMLGAEIDALVESVDRFYALLNDPDFGDETTTAELTEILTSWIGAYGTAQTLTPPPGYGEVHTAYLRFTGLLAVAATDLMYGDPEAAGDNLEQAQHYAAILADLLAEATSSGSDLLDRPSG